MEPRNIFLVIVGSLVILAVIMNTLKSSDGIESVLFKGKDIDPTINKAYNVRLRGFSYDFSDVTKHYLIIEKDGVNILVDDEQNTTDIRKIYPSFNGTVTDFLVYTPPDSQTPQTHADLSHASSFRKERKWCGL